MTRPQQAISRGDGYAVANLDDLGEGPGFRKIRKDLGVDRLRRQRDRAAARLRDRQPLPRRAGGALLPATAATIAIEFGDGTSHELEPGGLAWVDASTVRRIRNLSDSEEAVYVIVGGKDGYVGRDGKLPEGEISRFGDTRRMTEAPAA